MALQAVKTFRTREIHAFLRSSVEPGDAPFKVPNPFLPRLNPDSGRWAPPKYSMRRQADLVRFARASNTLHLLPPGPKLSLKELADAKSMRAESVTEADADEGQENTDERTELPSEVVEIVRAKYTSPRGKESAVDGPRDGEVAAKARGKASPTKAQEALFEGTEDAVLESRPETSSEAKDAKVGNKKLFDLLWSAPVEWEGEVKEKVVPGADVGNRLYAGKRRMFKGHKWERTQAERLAQRAQLMESMV